MWDWLKRMTSKNVSEVSMAAQPVEMNPTPSARTLRNRQRITRLQEAIARGDTRHELKVELARREQGGR